MSDDVGAAPIAEVQRTALYLDSPGGAFFAWLHEPPRWRRSDAERRGVVICPSVGHEQLHAHRSLRALADQLAVGGCTVLRIDYHGTGDSPGDELLPDRLDSWIENIVHAAEWLRASGKADRVTLAGFRAGALLAMAAAVRSPAEGLVLWAPPAKGSGFVRELRAISLTAAATANLPRRDGDPLESSGFRLSHETCAALGKLNAADLRPQVRRALVVSREDAPSNARLCEQLRAANIDAQEIGGPGFAEIVTLPHETQVPRDTIAAIASWVGAANRSNLSNEGREEADASALAADKAARTELGAREVEACPGVHERAVVLSDAPYLFGIASTPADAATTDERPWVVMINAGAAYRIAPGRLHVELARRLSSRGWRTLRFDLDGLGDSTSRTTRRENDPYPATALRDIGLALRGLRTQFAARRFVLVGLCSGAYDVFQFAAQNDDPTVLESLLINPLTFYWRDGMQVEDAGNLKWNTWLTYVDSALQWDKWRRLLTGKNRHGFVGTFKKFARGVGLWPSAAPAASQAAGVLSNSGDSTPDLDTASEFGGHPQRDHVRADLARIERSGRQLTMFFADSDPGPLILKMRAGRKSRQMQRDGRLTLQYFPDSDHTFSVARARDALIRELTLHLERRYLARDESTAR